MRIMVTGANGFVGLQLIRELIKTDHDVVAVDSLRYGPWRFSDEEMSQFSIAEIDITDEDFVQQIMEEYQPESIIHLAAVHFIPECEQKPAETVSINVLGTVNLLKHMPKGCRFVHTSSAAVYLPSEEPHTEFGSAIGPVDVYGYTKLHGEDYCKYFAERKDAETVVVRLFNVVGPGETNPHVLPEIIKQLKDGKRTLQLGNITPKRDYIHVADVARGFIACATGTIPADEKLPLTVNLGTGTSHSVAEMLEVLSEIIGQEIEVETDPARVRAVDRPELLADNSRMKSIFGWTAEHDLRQSLKDTWDDPNIMES